jgi:hypothetical protein
MTTTEIVKQWKELHLDEWRSHGHAHSAPEYAFVVAEHRLGQRASLSFGYLLGYGRVSENQARSALRAQVDAIINNKDN